YEADFPCGAPQRLKRLRKKSRCGPQRPSAAKAGIQNNAVIAALKRCATQNREQNRVFPQPVKRLAWMVLTAWWTPCPFKALPFTSSSGPRNGGDAAQALDEPVAVFERVVNVRRHPNRTSADADEYLFSRE